MKFTLCTSKDIYKKREDASEIEKLKLLGFTFGDIRPGRFHTFVNDEPLQIGGEEPEIELVNLDDLMKLSESYGQLVISPATKDRCAEIEIYNDYREG
jgi:hypothetical protein